MNSLIANSIASPGALPQVGAVSRQIKPIEHCSLRCSSLFSDNDPLKFCSLSTNLSDGRRAISLSSQRSASVICAAALNARCSAEQTQTVTRQSSTITVAPIQGKEKSPDLDDGGDGFPPRDDGDGGGGGGGGGGWSGGFFFFGFLAFLGLLRDQESESPYKD
ncbi:hypothetical protein DCAR_0521934 [Daucus carota subsp. sativus]|uniref:Uncharacterized protein n=1 Tax=Daucus carota subsp. sativus TaxID=79200 RepID=A0A164ZH99_DAUCS|nr:PREDICTED: uncharacterized protein LOC108220807 [Daucus carota subsp. sativus]WOH02545.1 hypothetical protein DCAR_0521934 [Daucus carota subsp. sativus]